MKKRLIKRISVILSVLMLFGTWEALPDYSSLVSAQTYLDESDAGYPERFDLREHGLVSSVKNQKDDATCMSFSSMSTIETSLMRSNPLIDLSEYHFAYFNYYKDAPDEKTDLSDFRNYGSVPISAAATLCAWIGAAAEALLPYGSDISLINEGMRKISDYHLQNSAMLSAYSSGRINAADSGEILSVDEMKEILYAENAVSITVCYDNNYYNAANAAYYRNYSGNANHALTVVGWDDSFSKENFNSYCRPENDGAWIVKNSWGADWGADGYFMISYEDKSLCSSNSFIVEPSDNYSHNYQYDSYGWSVSISADNINRRRSYMANIFTAEESESITAVGLYTNDRNTKYEISVYTGLEDENNPTSGTAHKATVGTQKYPGYHTIKLDESAEVVTGEKFSVVVRLINPDALYPIAAEAAAIIDERGHNENIGSAEKAQIAANTEAGQSFISSDGVKWTDTKGLVQKRTLEDYVYGDLEVSIYTGNVCLKAFSNPSDRIYFSKHSGDVPIGSQLELSGAERIYYTTDGTSPSFSSKLYLEPIVIDREMTVNAIGEYSGRLGNIYTSVYTQGRSLLSALSSDRVPLDMYDKDGVVKRFKLESTDSEILLSPCSTADITINGQAVESSHKFTVPLAHGRNEIIIRAFGESGKTETEYVVEVFRNYAIVDYKNEIIEFDDSLCTVTAENGHIFAENESISDYLGNSLTVKSSESEYRIKLPKRIILEDELSIGTTYYNEALTGLFLYSYDLIFSHSPDMRNAEGIRNRRIDLVSETRFMVYPGYEKDLYFQLPATDESPASTVIHYEVEDRIHAPENAAWVQSIGESSAELCIDTSFGDAYYSIEQMTLNSTDANEKERPKEKCGEVTLIENLQRATKYRIRVRFEATEERFSPYSRYIEFTTDGEAENCAVNFKEEIVYIDEEKCSVEAEDGTILHNYDSITPYIGQELTVSSPNGESYRYSVPSRPLAPKVEVDFIRGCIAEPLPENTVFTKTFEWGLYSSSPVEKKYICDSNGIVWLDTLFKNAYKSGVTLHFYVEATENAFCSEVSDFVIPDFPFTPQNMLKIQSIKSDSIALEYHEGMEYGIKTGRGSYKWQDGSVFEGLLPETSYKLAMRYKATETSYCSQPTYNMAVTSPQVLYGDIDGDGEYTYLDYSLLKQFICKKTKLDEYQLIAADMNGDGSVNVLDLIAMNIE